MKSPAPLREQSVLRYRVQTISEREWSICRIVQLPDRRLLCFLDDRDWEEFKAQNGIANRGFYTPVRAADPHWRIAPVYILRSVFPNGVLDFDDFIYVHGSACSSDIGLGMTLAHELQHFVQHTYQRRSWAANALVPKLTKAAIKELGSHGLELQARNRDAVRNLTWCDIPHEREARIVSKRTAENLFGTDAVRNYIDTRIEARVTDADADDWECIQGLAASTPYHLAKEIKLFFPRLKDYSPQLHDALRHQSNVPDFAEVDLDTLLSGTDPSTGRWGK